ncbi:MAG TPA: Ig-like domain-containing protein, partial [Myxococcales bacterium]|nr:Ig-like domain-containing protein [Myxococcales bacterium]
CKTVGDCPNTSNFTCDPNTNCCTFICQTAADCGGQFDQGDPCKTSPLGCVCDGLVCKSKQCSADGECASTQVCKGGTCQTADAASSVTSIVVEPNPAILHAGATQQFTATTLGASGAVILAPGSITWSISGAGAAGSSFSATTNGLLTVGTTGSAAFGDTTITATVGSVTGTAVATVYTAPASGTQVTVLDSDTNVPVTDATVEFTDATGAAISGASATSGSALGVYTLPATPANAVMLSVFEPKYQYVSMFLPSGGFSSNDLVVLLAQDVPTVTVSGSSATGPQPVVGGYTGDFQQEPGILDPNNGEPAAAKGDIHVGIAGTAVPQDLLDISLSALLGPSHTVVINIGGTHPVPLPQGIELGFGTTYFACSYDGLGAAGGCGVCSGGNTTNCMNPTDTETDPTQADWANSVFACGNRSAWGLGGGVPFSSISGLLGSIGTSNVDVGSLLAALLPDFSSFNSGVLFQVPYTESAPVPASQVVDSCTPGTNFTDSTPIPNPASLNSHVSLALNTPLALQTTVTLPALPKVSGTCQTTALVLGGAIEPGFGLLPLGLSAGSIDDQNNNPSSNCETYDTGNPPKANGTVVMSMAPEHEGVERDQYGVIALSLDVGSLSGSSSGPTAISGLVYTAPSLPYGSSVAFSAGSFPPYAQAATYDVSTRTYTNDTTTSGVSAAAWMRLRFQDSQGREWITYFPTATPSFVLPTPPASLPDVSATGGTANGAEAQLVLTGSLSYSEFFDFTNGAQAESLISQMTGFSAVGI